LPAAFVLIIFDLGLGWTGREETRSIARAGRKRAEAKKADKERDRLMTTTEPGQQQNGESVATSTTLEEKTAVPTAASTQTSQEKTSPTADDERDAGHKDGTKTALQKQPTTLESMIKERYQWAEETFPTTMTVFNHLPLPLLPFAFCMFVLVQALVTKGWVPVFAHGWDHWVEKTGTVGAVGGMGFLSVVLCNVSIARQYISTHKLLTLPIVRWDKHWNYDPAVACCPSLAGDPPPERRPHIGPHVLGHCV
jgi:hypothetical protein